MTGSDVLKLVVGVVVTYLLQYILKKILPPVEKSGGLQWFKWIIAGFLGGALGGLLSGLITVTFGGVPAANWAAFGGSIGLAQWLALRSYRPVGGWFVVASAIGWAIFPIIPPSPVTGWVAVGLVVGLLQYFSLRNYGRAYWWIVANPIVWLIATSIAILVASPIFGKDPIWGWIIGWGIVGLVGSCLLLVPLGFLRKE